MITSTIHDLSLIACDKINKNFQRDVKRCGLGANGYGSIGFDGSILGCQEQTSKFDDNNIFYLGNIYNQGIEKIRHEKLLKLYSKTIQSKSSNKN